jgi:hypothetical protein
MTFILNIPKYLALSAIMLATFTTSSFADCVDFEDEMLGPIGTALPNFSENGELRSIVVYGEDTFIAPKRSLIGVARENAELSAKRAFSEWLNGEEFSSQQIVQDFVEIVELTNQNGDTTAIAEEISQSLSVMRSDTSATIRGLIKLDECVDVSENYILVMMGWLNEPSAMTSGAVNDAGQSTIPPAVSTIVPSEGYRITSPLKEQFQ